MGIKSWAYSVLCAASMAFGGCYSSFPKNTLETIVDETKVVRVEKNIGGGEINKSKENINKIIELKTEKNKKENKNKRIKLKNKENQKLEKTKKTWKKLKIKQPELKFDEPLPLITPTFDHSVFGLKGDSGYLIGKGVKWNFGSDFYYNGFRFGIEDNLHDSLKEFSKRESNYSTPLDSFAEIAFKIRKIRDLEVGGFTVSELYNLCRLFGTNSRSEISSSGAKVTLDFNVDMHSDEEAYIAHYFRSNEGRLLRYRHGTGISLEGKVNVSAFYTLKQGKGMNIDLDGLEKLMGSELYFNLGYSLINSFSMGESFEQAEQTKRGWHGMGIVHKQFNHFLNKGDYVLTIDANIERQLIKRFRLFSASTYEREIISKNEGVFDLFYIFKEEDFKRKEGGVGFWYSAFVGLNRHDYLIKSSRIIVDGKYYSTIWLDFEEKVNKGGDYIDDSRQGFRIEHGGLLGFDLKFINPFLRWTTFPEKEIFSGFYVDSPLVGRISFSSGGYEAELLFPVWNKEDRERFIDSHKQIEMTLNNPFEERDTRIANIRRKGLSDADGHFIQFKVDEQYRIGFVHALKGPYFIKYGFNIKKEYSSVGAHIVAGIKNIGIEANYSRYSGFENIGHGVDFNINGEFNRYFFGFYIKGLFIGNTNTSLSEYRNPDDIRTTLSFGGILD